MTGVQTCALPIFPAMDTETVQKLRENITTGLQQAPEESKTFLKVLLEIIDRHLEEKK